MKCRVSLTLGATRPLRRSALLSAKRDSGCQLERSPAIQIDTSESAATTRS